MDGVAGKTENARAAPIARADPEAINMRSAKAPAALIGKVDRPSTGDARGANSRKGGGDPDMGRSEPRRRRRKTVNTGANPNVGKRRKLGQEAGAKWWSAARANATAAAPYA